MADLFVSSSREDRARVEAFVRLLKDDGRDVFWHQQELSAGGLFWPRVLEEELIKARCLVVFWTTASIANRQVRIEAYEALQNDKLLPVLLDNVKPPPEFRQTQHFNLIGWNGDPHDARLAHLLADLAAFAGFAEAPRPHGHPSHPMALPSVGAPDRPEEVLSTARMRKPGVLGSVVEILRDLWKFGTRYKTYSKPPRTKQPQPAAYRDGDMPQPVWLGASAPRHCSPSQCFTAALVAYVEAMRASAGAKLETLGEPGDRVVMDVSPQHNARWELGAPIAVRLTGEGVDVMPREVRFEWNGRENSAAFTGRVHDDAPAVVVLCFEVFVADVPIAYIPMRLSVAAQSAPLPRQHVHASVPNSAFASYSAKDAEPVTQRLSTLQRWSPMLDIFQDCLDLRPGASFQPQLKEQIARRDVFLLFWSRNAAASPWVKWEYQTACETRGLDAILPMPLEDVSIAPPPPELVDRHLRDRFMLAGYGLAKIREEAKRGRQVD